jgi:hypothetical protein
MTKNRLYCGDNLEILAEKSKEYSLLLLGIIEFWLRFLFAFGFLCTPECYIYTGNIGVI